MNGKQDDASTWFDHSYWGPGGPDLSRWGAECSRGVQYKETGAAVASGTAGVRRTLTGGRKHRGSASDDIERRQS